MDTILWKRFSCHDFLVIICWRFCHEFVPRFPKKQQVSPRELLPKTTVVNRSIGNYFRRQNRVKRNSSLLFFTDNNRHNSDNDKNSSDNNNFSARSTLIVSRSEKWRSDSKTALERDQLDNLFTRDSVKRYMHEWLVITFICAVLLNTGLAISAWYFLWLGSFCGYRKLPPVSKWVSSGTWVKRDRNRVALGFCAFFLRVPS